MEAIKKHLLSERWRLRNFIQFVRTLIIKQGLKCVDSNAIEVNQESRIGRISGEFWNLTVQYDLTSPSWQKHLELPNCALHNQNIAKLLIHPGILVLFQLIPLYNDYILYIYIYIIYIYIFIYIYIYNSLNTLHKVKCIPDVKG